jgi:uncharacterized protein YciI
MSTDRRLLGRDYWLILSTPAAGTGAADVAGHVDEHLDWLLGLEAAGVIVMSGPLTEGPGVRPGSGVTVLRAQSAEHAREIAAGDPFAAAGLRTFEAFRWQVNEGAIRVQLSLGTGTYTWD